MAKIASRFSRTFMEGFTSRCLRLKLDADESAELFHKYANMQMLAQPRIHEGFVSRMCSTQMPLTKSAMLRYATPEVLSLLVDCRVKYADSLMARGIRNQLNLPEPSWDTVPEGIQKAAGMLNQTLHNFSTMPLHQQILLASLVGGGLGGIKRMVAPSVDDQVNQRGVLSRLGRGAVHGGLTGAGAGLGAGMGSRAAGPGNQLPGQLLGGLAGGLGANYLANRF